MAALTLVSVRAVWRRWKRAVSRPCLAPLPSALPGAFAHLYGGARGAAQGGMELVDGAD